MSTKIWGGVKFDIDSFDINEIYRVINNCRSVTKKYFRDLLDRCKTPDKTHIEVYNVIKENFDVSISLFWDDVTSTWYGIVHCDPFELVDLLKQVPELVDFHYQNSTDRPDEISEKEWSHRREVWDRVLLSSKSSIPSEVGLIANLMPVYLFPERIDA
jgi:hypothetical protein